MIILKNMKLCSTVVAKLSLSNGLEAFFSVIFKILGKGKIENEFSKLATTEQINIHGRHDTHP